MGFGTWDGLDFLRDRPRPRGGTGIFKVRGLTAVLWGPAGLG